MQQVILTIVLIFSSILITQAQESKNEQNGTITVSVVNTLNDNGLVHFALFNKENFRKEPLLSKGGIIKDGISTVVFEEVPIGEYAIICFQDENNNDKMDFHENGMPKESYGTSNNALNFGPPQFEDSKFTVNSEPLTLEIKF